MRLKIRFLIRLSFKMKTATNDFLDSLGTMCKPTKETMLNGHEFIAKFNQGVIDARVKRMIDNGADWCKQWLLDNRAMVEQSKHKDILKELDNESL